MNKVKSIAMIVAAFGASIGAHLSLPEPYGSVLAAIIAAAAVLAKSPLESKAS